MIVNGVDVIIEEQDVSFEREFWGNTLILYALGSELFMNAVKKFMMSTWNFVTQPGLYYNEEEYFLIQFKTRADRDVILMRGPYIIYKKPMLLH